MDIEKEITKINKQITLYSVLDFPAVVALGVGLYSKFGPQSRVLHPLLSKSIVANSLIVSGGVIMLFCAVNVIRLHREKSRLVKR